MTILEIYVIFVLPITALLIGAGAVWLTNPGQTRF